MFEGTRHQHPNELAARCGILATGLPGYLTECLDLLL